MPFTPVTGNRLLVTPGPMQQAVTKAMAQTLVTLAGELKAVELGELNDVCRCAIAGVFTSSPKYSSWIHFE